MKREARMFRRFRWRAVVKFFWWFFVAAISLMALMEIVMWSNDSPQVLVVSGVWLLVLFGGRDLVRRLSASGG